MYRPYKTKEVERVRGKKEPGCKEQDDGDVQVTLIHVTGVLSG
jgi:hypothetical protein